ncbi:MAG: gliding motility-associated C-terminal domain-containing protein [Saprospiraceae bacterium]|nr:gliding motility-associated C-terminal domain-containing protein [Saprospiraceae bacterium]
MIKIKLILFVCFLLVIQISSEPLKAQICAGNKGINIFKDGDFGSGTSPVLLNNPNIAPGYEYTTNLPGDGFYSITNNTGVWNLYQSWLSIRNNSNDANGYMMVVNASYSPGIFYEKTINDICGNTLYEFSADVINLVKSSKPNHSDPVIDFLIDGVVRFSTGLVPKTERWITFGFTFTAPENASSVTLTLRNNAPGGFGNDLALDNISFRACGPSAFVGIDPKKAILLCIDDDPFDIKAEILGSANPRIIWQTSRDGIDWEEYGPKNVISITHTNFDVGTYYYRYLTAGDDVSILNEKCRVVSDEITVTVLPLEYVIEDSICDNQVYTLGNQKINKPGNYQATLTSSRGCDSIVYLNLKVLEPEVSFVVYDEICNHGIDILETNFRGGYFISVNNIQQPYINALPYRLPLKVGIVSTINFENEDGCVHNINVDIPDPKEVTATLDTTLISTNIYQLDIKSDVKITNIIWTSSQKLDCTNCLMPKIKIAENTKIEVVLIFENGCEVTLNSSLPYKQIPDVVFSNIFSPNGDGINDIFYIKYNDDNIIVSNFQIYDRWGAKVFSLQKGTTNDIANGWDGKFKNIDVQTGVYQFMVSLADVLDHSLGTFSGSITLVR